MRQAIQIIISLLLGFAFGILFKKVSNSLLLTLVLSTVFSIMYIILMYFINNGNINYILKISIVLGFIINYKVSNLRKKG